MVGALPARGHVWVDALTLAASAGDQRSRVPSGKAVAQTDAPAPLQSAFQADQISRDLLVAIWTGDLVRSLRGASGSNLARCDSVANRDPHKTFAGCTTA
jgi:hypothetical protein